MTTPLPSPSFIPRSNVQSPNRRDRPSVLLLTPGVIIPNSPKHNHEKDQDGPIEVGSIGARGDGEEHEDEQRGLERKGSEVRGKQEVSE